MNTFLQDETGAVTVDWVVLTAALVGLGLAATAVISGGLQNQSEEVSAFLTDFDMMDQFAEVQDSADFSDGRGNWVGGQVLDIAGFGEVLALSGGANSASLPIDIDGGYNYAQVEFDMIIGDSWDNETGTVAIGGTDVILTEHNWSSGAPEVQTFEGSEGTSVTLTRVSQGTGTWGANSGIADDYTYRVSVVAKNNSDLTLNTSTTLNQGASDEFFGIDNVTVTGKDRN